MQWEGPEGPEGDDRCRRRDRERTEREVFCQTHGQPERKGCPLLAGIIALALTLAALIVRRVT